MEPIISPLVVYLAGTVGAIKALFLLAAVLLGSAIPLYIVSLDCAIIDDAAMHKIKIMGIACIICIIISFLIPDEKTVWMMIGASYMTPDNITTVQENIINFSEQVAKAVK